MTTPTPTRATVSVATRRFGGSSRLGDARNRSRAGHSVTRWGVVLLIAYVALGLSPLGAHRAMRYALGLTAILLVAVSITTGAL